jgi:flagellar hook-length control protein FliK
MQPKPQQSQQQAASASDGAPSTFESMLDDTAQTAAPQPPSDSPSAAKADSTDQSQASPPTREPTANNGRARKSDETAKTDSGTSTQGKPSDSKDIGKTDGKTAAKADGNGKTNADAKADAKSDTQAAATTGLTPTLTDAAKPGDANPVVAALPVAVQTTTTTSAAPALADGAAAAAAIPAAVVAATIAPSLTATAAPTGKAAPTGDAGNTDAKDKLALFAQQSDGETPAADDPKIAAKAAALAHGDGKPVNPDEKQAAAPAHADRPAVEVTPATGAPAQATAAKAADAVQSLAVNAPVQNSAGTNTTAAPLAPLAQQAAQQAVPLAGVAIEIASKAVAGKNHFDIRLDPPELGRIEVRLDVGHDGSISSHVIADRKDTLDLLQRDSSGLQRAFEDAGLKTSDQGMQFSLRDHTSGQQQPMPNATTAQLVVEDETPIETLPVTYSRLAGSGGGLDIRV